MSRSGAISVIVDYLQQSDALPSPQLRRLGLIYSSYRLVVSLFFILMSYIGAKANDDLLLPSLLQKTALGFYVIISLILFALFFVVTRHPRRQLIFGLALDVIILSLLLYTSGAPDLQLTMLYMVVVAASFMLLHGPQALVITLLAIIFVIYQQFFYAIANSMSLNNLADALLISVSFLAVGFLSWSVSQRLVHVEKMAAQNAEEVKRLNAINQEVISQMLNGVMVIDNKQIIMANNAAYQLLNITADSVLDIKVNAAPSVNRRWQPRSKSVTAKPSAIARFQSALTSQHPELINSCLSVGAGQSRSFIYELAARPASLIDKLRVQIIPLKNQSQLILLEDLRREQAGAQQMKLASLGQLTASIAHEIRNPLAAISQASQLLMEDLSEIKIAENSVDSAQSELYQMIFDQTKRVNRIIEDVLKLSRQEPANQQQIDLAAWLPEFLNNYFLNCPVSLQKSPCPPIWFDSHQLEQILINLINNGLRFSRQVLPHSAVEIELYSHQNDVIIDILDDGLGVESSHLDELFNPFFTTDKSGTGLGLYLSQAFSGANHARLLYASDHPKTCFRLIIPKAQDKASS